MTPNFLNGVTGIMWRSAADAALLAAMTVWLLVVIVATLIFCGVWVRGYGLSRLEQEVNDWVPDKGSVSREHLRIVLGQFGWTKFDDARWRGDPRFDGLRPSEATHVVRRTTSDNLPSELSQLVAQYLMPVENPWRPILRSSLVDLSGSVLEGDLVGSWGVCKRFTVGEVMVVVHGRGDDSAAWCTVRFPILGTFNAYLPELYVRLARDPPLLHTRS